MTSKASNTKRKTPVLPLKLRLTRLGFGFYGAVAPRHAGRSVEKMFRRTVRRPRPLDEQAILLNAVPLTLDFEGLTLAGYEWRPVRDELDLPPVLLMHGWDSRASQLAPIVKALLADGHRVIAFDAPSHGDSPDRDDTTVSTFSDVVLQADRRFGPFHAALGHSVGGAAVLLAMARGLRTKRVITLAAPASLRRASLRVASMLGLPPRATAAMLQAAEAANGRSLDSLESTSVHPSTDVSGLLMHDPRDRQVPASESAIVVAAWPQATLHHIAGVGHNGILAADSVHRLVLDFIAPATLRVERPLALAS
jgi:pimeloyl-ACP methyl ester carboxylesterase